MQGQSSVHKKLFWSSDKMSDDSEQIIRHLENIIRHFSLNIHKKFFQMIRQYLVILNHPEDIL